MGVYKFDRETGREENKILELSGSFVDGYLLLHGRNQDRTRQGFVTFLLKIVGDGQRLSGQTSWLDARADKCFSRESTLYRDTPNKQIQPTQ